MAHTCDSCTRVACCEFKGNLCFRDPSLEKERKIKPGMVNVFLKSQPPGG